MNFRADPDVVIALVSLQVLSTDICGYLWWQKVGITTFKQLIETYAMKVKKKKIPYTIMSVIA